MKSERIQKVLANAGIASRRKIEEMILAGRITVNNKLAVLGQSVSDDDKIKVDGRIIKVEEAAPDDIYVIMYHKPEGMICTRDDPEGRPTVFEDLPRLKRGRWISVGRLDVNTSGLILFTNNGELANKLMHPSADIEREYAVRVHGRVTDRILETLSEGVELDDGPARFEDIQIVGGEGTNQWFYVVVKEGRNRVVRRLWESQGLDVSSLKRVRFGSIVLPKSLRRGQWAELTEDAVEDLLGY